MEYLPVRPRNKTSCSLFAYFGAHPPANGGVDSHARDAFAVEIPEVGAVAGHERLASEAKGSGKHWPILFGDSQRGFDCLGIGVGKILTVRRYPLVPLRSALAAYLFHVSLTPCSICHLVHVIWSARRNSGCQAFTIAHFDGVPSPDRDIALVQSCPEFGDDENGLEPPAPMDDPYNLKRFEDAQSPVYEQVCSELRAGRKKTHWIWFIFPQIKGLGHSEMASRFAISSLEEAQAYLEHPILGPRLRECTELVNLVERRSIDMIFGYPDDLKFRSSMTLFARAAAGNQVFNEALRKYFKGEPDSSTLERL
jgi:uncharacterized protein (DUF1810 family)